jgi:uncharacterized membrane protein YgcG
MKHKLFFFIGLAALLFTTPVNAQGKDPPIPNLPPQYSYVLDTLNWLSESQEQEINTIARQLDSEGKAQIYVATVDNCGIDKTQYRRNIFNAWKIGTQKSNGGLLIMVCWYSGDKSRRSIEVKTDPKMQIIIPDTVTAKIAENNFVSAFKANQPGAGLVKMVMIFDDVIRGTKSVPPWQVIDSLLGRAIILLFPFSILLFRGQGLRWGKRHRYGGGYRYGSGRRYGSSGVHYNSSSHYDGNGHSSSGDGGGSSTNF